MIARVNLTDVNVGRHGFWLFLCRPRLVIDCDINRSFMNKKSESRFLDPSNIKHSFKKMPIPKHIFIIGFFLTSENLQTIVKNIGP